MPSSTPKKALPKPVAPARAPAKPRAPKSKPSVSSKATPKAKVSKAVKTKKPAKAHKRTVSAPSGAPRSVQELYNLPWSHLSQEEKGRLLLPLLQGLDPNTGTKIGEAGSLLPPPHFDMVREDVFGTGDDGANFLPQVPTPQTSSPAANTTSDISAEGVAVFTACTEFNKQFDMQKKQPSPLHFNTDLPDFNFDMPDFQFDPSDFDCLAGFQPAGQGLGGPCGNGVIGAPVQKPTSSSNNVNANTGINGSGMIGGDFGQMPTPSGDYGRKRQQEALKLNAMRQAAGRRR
jgi:hypothetical protein